MMIEQWKVIPEFPKYSVSNTGHVRNDRSGRYLRYSIDRFNVVSVGLMRAGRQHRRSVPLLVARAFVVNNKPAFNTPINLNGNRADNHIDNLRWRPRWFAVEYNWQFVIPYEHPINRPIVDLKTNQEFPNSRAVATWFGLLEKDVVLSILNRTYCWPSYQQFGLVQE